MAVTMTLGMGPIGLSWRPHCLKPGLVDKRGCHGVALSLDLGQGGWVTPVLDKVRRG